jgi:hypothetical protein
MVQRKSRGNERGEMKTKTATAITVLLLGCAPPDTAADTPGIETGSGATGDVETGESDDGDPWFPKLDTCPKGTLTSVYDAGGEYLGELRNMSAVEFDLGHTVQLETADGWHRRIEQSDGSDIEGDTFGHIRFAAHNCSGPAYIPSPCDVSPLAGFPVVVVHFDTVWGPVTNEPTPASLNSRLDADGTCTIETYDGCAVEAHFVAFTPEETPLGLGDENGN